MHPIIPLNSTATPDQIRQNLNLFKIHALNYATKTISSTDAQYMEPKEVKLLVDMVLNLEDSVKLPVNEAEQVRTIQRLLERYSD